MDEAIDVDYTRQAWGDYLRTAFHQEGSQALYLLILKPWLALTSTEDWVVRLPSVVFAAAAVGLLVALAIRVFESRFVGIGAGLILATSVTSVSWSQQARQYALAMFCAVGVTYLLVWAVESDRLVPWLVYGAAPVLAVGSAVPVPNMRQAHREDDGERECAEAATEARESVGSGQGERREADDQVALDEYRLVVRDRNREHEREDEPRRHEEVTPGKAATADCGGDEEDEADHAHSGKGPPASA